MPKSWDFDKRCDECCNGDRCDDPTHVDRQNCRACKGTGWALWTEAGRRDYAAYLLGGNVSERRAAILAAVDGVALGAPPYDEARELADFDAYAAAIWKRAVPTAARDAWLERARRARGVAPSDGGQDNG